MKTTKKKIAKGFTYTACIDAAKGMHGRNAPMMGNCCGAGVVAASILPVKSDKEMKEMLGTFLKGDGRENKRTALFCTTTDREWQMPYTKGLLKMGYTPIAFWPTRHEGREGQNGKQATIYLWCLVAKGGGQKL